MLKITENPQFDSLAGHFKPKKQVLNESDKMKSFESIINHRRCNSIYESKSKVSKTMISNPYYFCTSKTNIAHQNKNITGNSLLNINSNYADKSKQRSGECTIDKEVVLNSLSNEKQNSLAEMEKPKISIRQRIKSVNNVELQKFVNRKLNENPSIVRATVNKWLKETLPTVIKEKDSSGESQVNKMKRICNDINQKPNKILLRSQLKREFTKLEQSYTELLMNSKSKAYRNATKFYKLLHKLYDSLQKIDENSTELQNTLEANRNIPKLHVENRESKMGRNTSKYSEKEIKSDLSSLDLITHSSSKSITNMSKLLCNTTTCSTKISKNDGNNIGAVKTERKVLPKLRKMKTTREDTMKKSFEKEIVSSSPYRMNLDKSLVGELLSLPRIEVKSKCVVGVFKNFVEEQYIISGFKAITQEEREEILKGEWKKEKKSPNRLIHLTTNCTGNIGDSKYIVNDKNFQTEPNELNNPQNPKNAASQTFPSNNSLLVSKATKDETLSWQSDNISNDEFFYQLDDEIVSSIIFEDNKNEAYKVDLIEIDNSLVKERETPELYTVKNQEILQQATMELFNLQISTIDSELLEISKWNVHASRVKSCNNQAFSDHDQFTFLKSELVKNSTKYHPDDRRDISTLTRSNNLKYTNGLLPPIGKPCKSIKSPTHDLMKSDEEKVNLEYEHSFQEIKDYLKKDIPLPENLSILYERLSKLQNMLEGIPEDKLNSTLDALDQLNSSTLDIPNMNGKPDYDQDLPTSLGDCTGKETVTELPMIEKCKHPNLNTDYPSTMGDPVSLRCKRSDSTFEDDQSDVTNSLSMLENLIDDFLAKNGLANMSKF